MSRRLPPNPHRPNLLGVPPFEEWSLRAACRGMIEKDDEENDQWHPVRPDDVRLGKLFCNGPDLENRPDLACPVRDECGRFAIAHGVKTGTWGGMDEWERANVVKRRSRVKQMSH